MRARFGDLAVDFDRRQLMRGEQPLHLTPKAYQLLALRVDAEPRALSKDELQQGLWPSTFVDEANLTVLVAELRAALDDDARQPRFVRTVHGFGYAFAGGGHARRGPNWPGAWWLHADTLHVKLEEGDTIVGRELPSGSGSIQPASPAVTPASSSTASEPGWKISAARTARGSPARASPNAAS